MATAVPPRARGTSERRFYSYMALLMIALVLIGFGPSFYLRGIVPSYPRPNPTLSPMVVLHGLMFTLWLLVFWAQTALVAAGRRDLHIRLGQASMVLAVLLVPMMYAVAVGQVARHNGPPFTSAVAWTAVPLGGIPSYIALLWLGWSRRRDAQAHKRLMLSAALLFMGPALGRFPVAPPVLAGHALQQLLAWLTFVPLFWWDRKTLGRLHWATKTGAALVAIASGVPILLLLTPWWPAVAAQLPGI